MNRLCRIVGIVLIGAGATTSICVHRRADPAVRTATPAAAAGDGSGDGHVAYRAIHGPQGFASTQGARIAPYRTRNRRGRPGRRAHRPAAGRRVVADAAVLELARVAGFTVLRTESLATLGLTLVVFEVPKGMSTRRALKRLRELDPEGDYDYNHLYLGAGLASDAEEPVPQPAAAAAAVASTSTAVHIGLIDSGVDGAHPVLAGSNIVRHDCDGKAIPAPHGTAVASLLIGSAEGFQGVIPGATLYAADIFCGHGGGSMGLLAIALDWMAREQVPVVNISLVGAKSILLTGLVRAMTARGHLLVAAVGNDGPTAPPLYPAAYPDVVGVTGVDATHKVLPEACARAGRFCRSRCRVRGRGHRRRVREIRGTSFATPIVAALSAGSLRPRILRMPGVRYRRSRRPRSTSATTASTRLMVKAWWALNFTRGIGKKRGRRAYLLVRTAEWPRVTGASP